MPRKQQNPHAELCAWANGLRADSPQYERTNMSKHTKGPWTAHPDIGEDNRGMGWIRTSDGRDVSCYGTQELWMSENIANGKLMAAAPELLEKAKALLDAFGGDTPSWCREESQALADVIAKATT